MPLRPISVQLHHASVIDHAGEQGGSVHVTLDDEGDDLYLDIRVVTPDELEDKTVNVMIPWTELSEVVQFIVPVGHSPGDTLAGSTD
jgi:hypothetical protein